MNRQGLKQKFNTLTKKEKDCVVQYLLEKMESLAYILKRDGVVVITDTYFSKHLEKCRKEFLEESKHFPEFLEGVKKFVVGGFAALGNASSFHNPTVRRFREIIMMEVIVQVFSDFMMTMPKNYKLEQIIDRMMIRLQGESPSKETWHRDEANLASPDDLTFGGWLNLDNNNQYFSCVKGTHTVQRGAGGFSKIKKTEHTKLNEASVKIKIPPGAILIFYEHLVHEVVPSKAKYTMCRLFTGFRITTSNDPLIPNLKEILDNQGVVPLKSGQIPPMYAKLHWVNHIDMLKTWSEQHMKEECLEVKTYKTGKRAGQQVKIVHNIMKSLREYNFPLYPKYTKEEVAIYKPNRKWELLGKTISL